LLNAAESIVENRFCTVENRFCTADLTGLTVETKIPCMPLSPHVHRVDPSTTGAGFFSDKTLCDNSNCFKAYG
jgi:hypothetical protein